MALNDLARLHYDRSEAMSYATYPESLFPTFHYDGHRVNATDAEIEVLKITGE
jgi:hypothetical protein